MPPRSFDDVLRTPLMMTNHKKTDPDTHSTALRAGSGRGDMLRSSLEFTLSLSKGLDDEGICEDGSSVKKDPGTEAGMTSKCEDDLYSR